MNYDILNEINCIIKNIINIDIISVEKENEHFFSKHIGIAARDLVAILYAIENKFQIRLTEDEIQNDIFYNLYGLSHIVSKKCL